MTIVTNLKDDFDLEEFVFCAANERDMFRTAAPKFLETDWIDESLRDVASMFSDDGDENESIIAHKAPMIGRHLAGDRLVGRCSGNSRTFLDAS